MQAVFLRKTESAPIKSESGQIFRFGLQKAKLIITAIECIKKFYNTKTKWPPTGEEIYVEDQGFGFACKCLKYDQFGDEEEGYVPFPYLRLSAMPYGDPHIGLGQYKAMVIMMVEQRIKNFVRDKG